MVDETGHISRKVTFLPDIDQPTAPTCLTLQRWKEYTKTISKNYSPSTNSD